MMMFRCSFFVCFMPWRCFWIVFDCIKVDFKDETRGETPPVLLLLFFCFFCNYRLVFFMYAVKVCVYLNMLRVPKISSKPNEVSVALSSTTSATLWSTRIQNDSVFLFRNGRCCRREGDKTKLLWLLRHRLKSPVFSPFRSRFPLPLPLSRMSSISRTQFWFHFFSFFWLFDFHVDVISKVVSLALTVCVWLVDSTCWLF